MSEESFTIFPRGPFSLAEAASFGFGQREGQDTGAGNTKLMRLAFCVDGYAVQAGVEVRQDAAGDVRGTGSLPPGTDPGPCATRSPGCFRSTTTPRSSSESASGTRRAGSYRLALPSAHGRRSTCRLRGDRLTITRRPGRWWPAFCPARQTRLL